MFYGIGILILIALAFAFFLPRAGLFVGPLLIVLGIAPLSFLYLVHLLPSVSPAHAEEHYGLLSTLAFLVLTPSGVVITFFSVLSIRR